MKRAADTTDEGGFISACASAVQSCNSALLVYKELRMRDSLAVIDEYFNDELTAIPHQVPSIHPLPTPPGKSWEVLDFFVLKIPGPVKSWKIIFGPGKSGKLKLEVMESPGKISLKVMHFSSGLNGKQAAIV